MLWIYWAFISSLLPILSYMILIGLVVPAFHRLICSHRERFTLVYSPPFWLRVTEPNAEMKSHAKILVLHKTHAKAIHCEGINNGVLTKQ